MSSETLQNLLARLIIDPDYRDEVREEAEGAFPEDLSRKERRRLIGAARDPGMDVTSTLHKAFRLNELLGQLPLTVALFDKDLLAEELGTFWQRRLPRSFYYLGEAIGFTDHLLAEEKRLAVPFLREIVSYEQAELTLQLPIEASRAKSSVRVDFRHDPRELLGTLRSGRRPVAVAELPCSLIGARGSNDEVVWPVLDPRTE